MRRAYHPRPSTHALVHRIEALDGVQSVELIAPNRGSHPTPAGLRVYLTHRWPGERVFTDFETLAEARAWLATEEEAKS